MDKRHQQKHECHRSRWEQCRVERSRCDVREKLLGRAHRSPLLGRFPPRAPYSFKYRSSHEVNFVTERLCVQVGSNSCKCSTKKLQAGYPERLSHYWHHVAYQQNPQGANGSFPNEKYGASLIARSHEAFVDFRKPDVYQFRQCFYWRPTGFSRSWFGERCRSRGWLPEEPVQFSKFWPQLH